MLIDFSLLKVKSRKAIAQLPQFPKTIGLLWQAAGTWTGAWIVLLIIQGLLPAAAVYLTKSVVDGVVAAVNAGSTWPMVRQVLLVVAALAAVMIVQEVVRGAISWVRVVQAELLQDHINDLIHQKSITADLAFYEFADYYDHLHRARREASYRPVALIENIGSLLQNGITLVAMAVILIPLGLWLTIALVLSTLPAFFVVVRYALVNYQWHSRITVEERRAWYYDQLMTSVESAAELRLFGLGDFFRQSYNTLRIRLRTERLQIFRSHSIAELGATLIALVITGAAMIWMVWKAVNGLVSLGDLALMYVAFNQGQRLMRTLVESAGQLYANSLFLGSLFEFLAMQPIVKEADSTTFKRLAGVNDQIRFHDVVFRYPDSEIKALDDFELTIPAGKILAIVGPNGAGKSTVVKLLCRFYDVQQGAVTIDGVDVKDVPVSDLRSLLTVLFQVPVHYNATVRENIQFGDLRHKPSEGEIQAAIDAAGAEEIVRRLGNGYDALLGKWFAGGTELSVGEWQRVALARAFLRQAPVIILDEPTSALDPWAEADWLMRFRRLAAAKTAIIITHRFTTAMHADVIHVMKDGRIVESGTHEQLIERDGMYADSWRRQMTAVEREMQAAAG
ncbi:MAG TPA: ABC transporter ATP-binding protein [Pyrinomonadaceae bacterium]|nr:ABC transporter ATP-binding protein [Pyrinomonadaceae bacterium]